MTSKKKTKRLQTAGWKVGDAKDFLQLTDAEAAEVEQKLESQSAKTEMPIKPKMDLEELRAIRALSPKVKTSHVELIRKMRDGEIEE